MSLGVIIGGLAVYACLAKPELPPQKPPHQSVVRQAAGDAQRELGKRLFLREWLPNDPRSHGGDGLGPVFNDSSCVACHNLGGIGGGGPVNKNVEIVSAFFSPPQENRSSFCSVGCPRPALPVADFRALPKDKARQLADVHAGFRSERSVVLHRFGTDTRYREWWTVGGFGRPGTFADVPGSRSHQRGDFLLRVSHRNTTALFGAGLIDSIPDEVLKDAATKVYAGFPGVTGRVCRLPDERIGRFGWKAQKASLREFAMAACAVELGLNVPEQEQSGLPYKPTYRSPGFDMNQVECDALVKFLKDMPAPVQRPSESEFEASVVSAGRDLFTRIGCAVCHTPKLGDVDGLYSDLLLHDMGDALGDTGSYGAFVPDPSQQPPPESSLVVADGAVPMGIVEGAERLEWRTPPLWGLRDSGPYLHDGRADTIDHAIGLHGGEAAESSRQFFALPAEQRSQVIAFLKTLVAPMEPTTAP